MSGAYFTCINGDFVEASAACLLVSSRVSRYGDGVFETVRLVDGKPYQWALHQARLARGAEMLHLGAVPDALPRLCRELAERNAVQDGFLRISLSRGGIGAGFLPQEGVMPNLAIESLPPRPVPLQSALHYTPSYRPVGESIPGNLKTMQGLGYTLARREASQVGAFEALLCDSRGRVSEGSSSNLFWVKAGTLYTPALSCGGVDGTLRRAVMRLSPLPVQEVEQPVQALQGAEELFLTNVSWLVLPVTALTPQGWIWPEGETVRVLRDVLVQDRAANSGW